MMQVQDTVITNVQRYVSNYFADSMTTTAINDLSENLEVIILDAFYQHGIPSNPKSFKDAPFWDATRNEWIEYTNLNKYER